MPVCEHVVSYRNGPYQVMVAGLQPSLRDMGYGRGARVQVADPAGDPAHAPWVFVVSNDEYATLVCQNPAPPAWIQPGVRIRIDVRPLAGGGVAEGVFGEDAARPTSDAVPAPERPRTPIEEPKAPQQPSVSAPTYVGIDFSGDQAQWNPNVQASNIWIAEVQEHGASVNLVNLQRVQQLPGQGRPFARLSTWLANGNFSAAAIDAPFSIPWWFFGQGFADHPGLLKVVNNLPLMNAQDFPTGNAFIASAAAGIPFHFSKPLRVTDCYWRGRGVNIRSTVWAGPRPGAPFTSACIKLLANVNRPVWPWAGPEKFPLVEAFPAAQLRHWGLPFARYNGLAGQANRAAIVLDLTTNRGLQANNALLGTLQADADALDAVLCSYAARAVVQNQLGIALPPFDAWQGEGWIAIHN